MLDENYVVKRILYLCEKQGISRYRLSKLSGISQSSISNLVKRRSIPNIETLDRICEGFGITLSQFFANEEVFSDLSHKQNELLMEWNELSGEEKNLVQAYMRGLKHK